MSSHTILKRSGLDVSIAVFLAEASSAAYTDPASKAWASSVGFTNFKHFNRENVQGFWCNEDDVALLAFRGTSNPGQWIRDARIFPVKHPWGMVHEGFQDGVADVEQDLKEFDKVASNAKHVWITGHSLGGALAVMAAARLKIRGIKSLIYTYGQPMVGLDGFADRFAIELPGRLVRFVNQSDIVPRVPPGFNHFGILKRIVRPGVLESIQSMEAVPLPDSVAGSAKRRIESATLETALAIAESKIAEPLLIDSEMSSLTTQQYQELRAALGASSDMPALEGIELEGLLPWFSDHAISEYIRLLTEIRG